MANSISRSTMTGINRFLQDKTRYERNLRTVSAGMLTGIFSGLVMALLSMTVSASLGQGFWMVPKLIAGLFLGVDALIGGLGTVLLGLAIHLTVSALLGGIFSLIYPKIVTKTEALRNGLLFGAMTWITMNYLVLPIANPTMNVRVALAPDWWFLEHLVFGSLFFATPVVAQAFTKRSVLEEEFHVEPIKKAA